MTGHALIIEDHTETRHWLHALLQQALPSLTVHTASSMQSGLALIPAHDWRIVLIDLGLPDGSGMTLLEALHDQQPSAQSVVVTVHSDDRHLFRALAAGAQGYLLKSQPSDQLVEQLRQFNSGMPLLAPAIARRMLAHFRGRTTRHSGSDEPPLTPQETDILRGIGRGLKISEVAACLNLTESTVASYVKQIYRKLSISNRAQAALEAARRGLLNSPSELH
jgi:DNA-binding NarL/FixJ family response regulator